MSLWRSVDELIGKKKMVVTRKNDALVLIKLSMLNMGWLEMIPAEWREIYGALFDEATDRTGCPPDDKLEEEYAEDHTTIRRKCSITGAFDAVPELHASEEKKKMPRTCTTFSVFAKHSCSKYTGAGV